MNLRNNLYVALCLAALLSCALHSAASEAVAGLEVEQYERLLSAPLGPEWRSRVDAVRLFGYWHYRLNETMHPYPPDADVLDNWNDTYFQDLPAAQREQVVRGMSLGVYHTWKQLARVYYCCRHMAMTLSWLPGYTHPSPALAACEELQHTDSALAAILAEAYTGVDILPSMCAEDTLEADAKSILRATAGWAILQPDGVVWTLDRASRMYAEAHMKAQMQGLAPNPPAAVARHYATVLRRV
jgi:hypothetical protein